MSSSDPGDLEQSILERLTQQFDRDVREFLQIPEEDLTEPSVTYLNSYLDGAYGEYVQYYFDRPDADEIHIGADGDTHTLFHELVHFHADQQEWDDLGWGTLEEGLTELLTDEYFGGRHVHNKEGREMAEDLLEGLEASGYTHEQAIELLKDLHQDPTILPTVMEAAGVDDLPGLGEDISQKAEAASEEESDPHISEGGPDDDANDDEQETNPGDGREDGEDAERDGDDEDRDDDEDDDDDTFDLDDLEPEEDEDDDSDDDDGDDDDEADDEVEDKEEKDGEDDDDENDEEAGDSGEGEDEDDDDDGDDGNDDGGDDDDDSGDGDDGNAGWDDFDQWDQWDDWDNWDNWDNWDQWDNSGD